MALWLRKVLSRSTDPQTSKEQHSHRWMAQRILLHSPLVHLFMDSPQRRQIKPFRLSDSFMFHPLRRQHTILQLGLSFSLAKILLRKQDQTMTSTSQNLLSRAKIAILTVLHQTMLRSIVQHNSPSASMKLINCNWQAF